jgi:ribosomal protein L17
MKTPNRERQRKWKKKQVSNGMRAVTVMLPSLTKDLIDKERKETGETVAKVIERAVINLLGSAATASNRSIEAASNNVLRELPTEDMQQVAADLRNIVHRFAKLAGIKPSVTSNKLTVTNDGSGKPEQQDGYPKEIYRLVRLLHNMEVSYDEIACTLNKRKYTTLSGDNEWKIGDVKEVLNDISQKYGHINPLFSISDNP